VIEVLGITEVTAALAEAGVVKIPAAVRRVTVEGAKPIKAAIKAEAPVGKRPRPWQNDEPGNLRRSVRYKVSRGSKGERYTIGAFGRGSAHRGLVIYGHEKRGGGGRTTANQFVRRGGEAAESGAVAALEAAAAAAIRTVTR
jgi:hypothetical protein